ncbi:hypothetical protein BY458DRAFT_506505 [Sporodiniella umbellata]|nr:hypothetical protein BY458DRAFT_506505 [Sporodiniella umbellata]
MSYNRKHNNIPKTIQNSQCVIGEYPVKLHASYSTPSSCFSYKKLNTQPEPREKNQLLRDLYQVKKDILKFKTELNGLAEQMDGMELDLNASKDRVQEIEQDITETQEVNVNLQLLLERAVDRQKETDVHATQAMKSIHSNLISVVQETGQLRGRLTSIADYQRQQQGNVVDVGEKIREYGQMLEDAIQSIQTRPSPPLQLPLAKEISVADKRKKPTVDNNLYKHRIIRKRISNPEIRQPWLPQKGLRILLNDS